MLDGVVSTEPTSASTHVVVANIVSLSLELLHVSTTKAQAERRTAYDKSEIMSLAMSIKAQGLIHAILVRPHPTIEGHYEIVVGEQRFLAHRHAGLATIKVEIRVLSDAEVEAIQLIENLLRKAINAMVEAEGYETLRQQHGYGVEKIAAEVGKKAAYIYDRLKLLALCPAARESCRKGELPPATAAIVALIKDPVLQNKHLAVILHGYGNGVMTPAQTLQYVRREVLLQLARAPFDTRDETLIPAAGPCGRCPKKTGNQPGLFADVREADLCTDLPCFRAKQQAAQQRKIEAAHAQGQRVIEGAEAKRIARAGVDRLEDGYVALDTTCSADPKGRSYRELLGKRFKPVLIVNDTVIEAVDADTVREQLKARGIKPVAPRPVDRAAMVQRAEARAESDYRRAVHAKVREKTPATLTREDLIAIALVFYRASWQEIRKEVIRLWQWQTPGKKGVDEFHLARAQIPKLSVPELNRLLCDLAFSNGLSVSIDHRGKPTELLAAAKRRGVSLKGLRPKVTQPLFSQERKSTKRG